MSILRVLEKIIPNGSRWVENVYKKHKIRFYLK